MSDVSRRHVTFDLVSPRAFCTLSCFSSGVVLKDIGNVTLTAHGEMIDKTGNHIPVNTDSGKAVVEIDGVNYQVDRLVLSTYERIPNRYTGKRVIHLNGDAFDNYITNLAWAPLRGCADDINWMRSTMYPVICALNHTQYSLSRSDISSMLTSYFTTNGTIDFFHSTLFKIPHAEFYVLDMLSYFKLVDVGRIITGFNFTSNTSRIRQLTTREAANLAGVDVDTFIQKMIMFSSPAFSTGWMFVANPSIKWAADNEYSWPWSDNRLPIGIRNREAYAIMQLVTHERVIEKLNPNMTVERYVSFQDALDKNPEMTITKLRNALRAPRIQVCDVTDTYWGYFPEITDAMVDLYL